MFRYRLLLVMCVFFFLPDKASSFGLKTHIWIGQQIIEDLKKDCSFRLANRKSKLDLEICESILNNQSAFIAGVLGPDSFPDLITGQVTTHPGIEGDWQTSDWLKHLYLSASKGPELAFSAGYLVAPEVFLTY